MTTFRTFIRSAHNYHSRSSDGKVIIGQRLSYEEAQTRCKQFNSNLTEKQKAHGTKLELEPETPQYNENQFEI